MHPQNKTPLWSKLPLPFIGLALLLLAALGLLWSGNSKSIQSVAPRPAQVYFEGEYRIADGPWQEIVPGQHIPATRGDVTLRGSFHLTAPNGEYIGLLGPQIPVAFFSNHISITVYENGFESFVLDSENPLFGTSACGEVWASYSLMGEGTEPLEILLRNPHRFGNETAVDDFIDGFALWINLDFEKKVLDSGQFQRDTGMLIIIISLILLGTALFSTLLHINNSKLIWFLGLATAFAGIYFAYGAPGVFFWKESVVSNTTMLCLSMMFYMLCVYGSITVFLKRTKTPARIATALLGAANGVLILLTTFTEIRLFDCLLPWVMAQTAANIVLAVCLAREFLRSVNKYRFAYLSAILPLAAFEIDVLLIGLGVWQECAASMLVFSLMLIAALVLVLRIIPASVTAATKAKELEAQKKALDAELAKSRISTMMSQIRPHFIYNALGSIEQLCELDPPKAGKLVHNFAKYLRGNFGELDNTKPIHMSQEMEHVRHYISIENVRFPDMTFTFVMNSGDFLLPALTIQPVVENAIKHGLMKLEQGGSIRVASWETDTHYCVSVEDDGAGFDTGILLDERKHIGLRNIRGRLEAMVNGTLEIESTPGKGTKVLIKIPKEVSE